MRPPATESSVAELLEIEMKRKLLLIGGIATATLLAGGWALAQSRSHGPGGFGPPFMHGMGHGGMGPGMMRHMGRESNSGMGPGMMGMGPGMMGGSATMGERSDIHDLFFNHDRIKRTVTNLPNGIRTVTESDDPQLAEVIKRHVAEMGKRVDEGRDPGLPIETPALHAIFRYKDTIKSAYEVTEKGVIVTQTSTDAAAVKALQEHAAEVSDLARRGMVAAHEAMMRNGGMMGGMMHGAGPDSR
jgi:hypothetical protein